MNELLIIDTETGGLDPGKYSILSLGAVAWRPGEHIDQCEIFVAEPEILCEPDALNMNRMDLQWLKTHGVRPSVAIERLHSFLKKNFPRLDAGETVSLAGHNVGFDVSFLRRLYRLGEQDFDRVFSHRLVDTASIGRFLILAGRLPVDIASSSKLIEHFGIRFEPKERHTALGDARATARLLDRLIELVKV